MILRIGIVGIVYVTTCAPPSATAVPTPNNLRSNNKKRQPHVSVALPCANTTTTGSRKPARPDGRMKMAGRNARMSQLNGRSTKIRYLSCRWPVWALGSPTATSSVPFVMGTLPEGLRVERSSCASGIRGWSAIPYLRATPSSIKSLKRASCRK